MTTFIIDGKGNNEHDFCQAYTNYQVGDTIKLGSGEYFDYDSALFLVLDKNITIEGSGCDSDTDMPTILNCGFLISHGATVILKNLSLNYPKSKANTVCLFQESKLYANGVNFYHDSDDHKDTICSQNSYLSLVNSQIKAGNLPYSHGLVLLNSKMYGNHLQMACPYFDNSFIYIFDGYAYNNITLVNHCDFNFTCIGVNDEENHDYSDFYLGNDCHVDGYCLYFSGHDPLIDVNQSTLKLGNPEDDPMAYEVFWKYDDESEVLYNGEKPEINY